VGHPMSAFLETSDGRKLYDNTRLGARLYYRLEYYARVSASALGRIPVRTQLRSHFPFAFPDAPWPTYLTVEFTNYCNLACPYCTSPLGIRNRGMMDDETFSILVKRIGECDVPRIRVVGNGEPTLHPRFKEMILELGKVSKYLAMVTNAQRLSEEAAHAILRAPVRLVEVSADSDNKAGYEASRIHGNFERLLRNLAMLKDLRNKLRAPTMINIRAMIRPSQKSREREILKFWHRYADTAMPQYLFDYTRGKDSDVFEHRQNAFASIPRCSLPIKGMILHYNGRVPLCELSQRQTGIPEGLIAGDIHSSTIRDIWNSPLFRQYRFGHRARNAELTPICRGCLGG
jgi:MoaA/NifB/PqqE/SkfB family radical SAM enzyme